MLSSTRMEKKLFKSYLAQITAVTVKNILLITYGLSLSIPTLIIPSLSQPSVNNNSSSETIYLDEHEISWIGSLNFLCVPLGCLASGFLMKPVGRIRSMQIISLLFCAAFILFYFSHEIWHFFFGLFLTGFSGGLLEAPTLIYTVEITEIQLRGAMCSTSTLAIVIGMMITFTFGTNYSWRMVSLMNSIIPLVGFFLLFFIPESPHWLLIKNKPKKAQKNLAWLRGWIDLNTIDEEFQMISKELQEEKTESFFSTLKEFKKSTFIKPFMLINLTFILAHAGTSEINTYAIKLFNSFKVPIDSYRATALIGLMEFLGSVLLMLLVPKFGKRLLIFITEFGVALGFLILGFYAYFNGVNNFNSTSSSSSSELIIEDSWISLIVILAIVFFSYLMTFTLPWIIMGEIYPSNIRDIASGLSATSGYIIGFIFNKTFLNLINAITLAGVFGIYSLIAIIGIILLYFFLPETEGRNLFEITEYFAGRRNRNFEGIPNKAYENTRI